MALKAGYYGIKKKLIDKINNIANIRTIGAGLSLTDSGVLNAEGSNINYNNDEKKAGFKWYGTDVYMKSFDIYSGIVNNVELATLPAGAEVIKIEGLLTVNSGAAIVPNNFESRDETSHFRLFCDGNDNKIKAAILGSAYLSPSAERLKGTVFYTKTSTSFKKKSTINNLKEV